jgi:putative methyltransferase (TIGR04325 family)
MVRSIIRKLLPAFLERWLRHYRWRQGRWPKSEWTGDYPDWSSAKADSVGYDNAVILERVAKATQAVQQGKAAFERDGVTFAQHAYDPAVGASLIEAVASSRGELFVTDFGGSLGSLFYQYRPVLKSVRSLKWIVVEQPHFVERGKAITVSEELSFVSSLQEIPAHATSGVLLLGSVLSYLPDPEKFLQEVVAMRFRFILIDRTACIRRRPTRLTVQHVPASVYPASYPAWLFNQRSLLAPLASDYRLLRESVSPFSSPRIQEDGAEVEWKSFFFERKR